MNEIRNGRGRVEGVPHFPRSLDRVLVLSLLAFLLLVILVEGRISQAGDDVVVREVDEHRNPQMTIAMLAVTHLGSIEVLWALAIPIAGLFIWLRRFDFAVIQLTLLAGAGVLTESVKMLTHRVRPLAASDWSSYSFPSGHTLAAMSFYFGLFYLMSLLYEDKETRRRLRFIGLTFAGLIGFSRVYLAVHYPTDVIAAVALAFAWMAAVGLVSMRIIKKRRSTMGRRNSVGASVAAAERL